MSQATAPGAESPQADSLFSQSDRDEASDTLKKGCRTNLCDSLLACAKELLCRIGTRILGGIITVCKVFV